MAPGGALPTELLPFSVIGGYLGAGKTTLVNRILHDPAIGRAAVLVNDFGEINIDSALIESHNGDTISLANGCVCCSLVDGLSVTLARIRESADEIDRVIVEVSGVGDPWKVAQWGRTPGFRLDAVLTLADAETVIERSADRLVGETVRLQLAGADIVVVTKADLVEPERLTAVHDWLTTITDASVVVGSESVDALLRPSTSNTSSADNGAHDSGHARHVVATRQIPGAIESQDLERIIGERPKGIMRVKGRIKVAGVVGMTLVQIVGRRAELTIAPEAEPGADPDGVLVAVALPGTPPSEVERWLAGFSR